MSKLDGEDTVPLPDFFDTDNADIEELSSEADSAESDSLSVWLADPLPIKGKGLKKSGRDFELDFDITPTDGRESVSGKDSDAVDYEGIKKSELRELYNAGLWAPRPEFYLSEADELDGDADISVFQQLKKSMTLLTAADDTTGYVYKRVLHGGSAVIPESSSIVTLHYVAYVEYGDDPVDVAYSRSVKRSLRLQLDKGNALPGFEMAVKSMSTGEWSFFIVSPSLAYGARGCPPRYPGNSEILYFIEFVSILPNDCIERVMNLAPEEREELGFDTIRSVATRTYKRVARCYKMQNFRRAQATQKWIIDLLEHCPAADEAESSVRDKMLVNSLTTGALIALKTDSPKLALFYTRNALQINASHQKTLVLRIMAQNTLRNFTEAVAQCKRALQHHPASATLQKLLHESQAAILQESAKEKEMCRRMMGLAPTEKPKIITSPPTPEKRADVSPVRRDLALVLDSFCKDEAISEIIIDGTGYSFQSMRELETMITELGMDYESFLDSADGRTKLRVSKSQI